MNIIMANAFDSLVKAKKEKIFVWGRPKPKPYKAILRPRRWYNPKSFRGLRPLDPRQGYALVPLGGLQRPHTPSCYKQ